MIRTALHLAAEFALGLGRQGHVIISGSSGLCMHLGWLHTQAMYMACQYACIYYPMLLSIDAGVSFLCFCLLV